MINTNGNPGKIRLYRYIGIIVAVAVMTGCASRAGYATKLLYQSDDFDGADFSHRTILLLPVTLENGFDTTGMLSPSRQAQWLLKRRPDLKFVFRNHFESTYYSAHDKAALNSFYGALFEGDVLAAQTSDSVWAHMKADYLLVTSIKNSATIRDFERNIKKTLRCETELWDIENTEVVWRISTVGNILNGTEGDAEFIWGALQEAYNSIPAFRPALNEENW
ncbi:MAG: hypothetical protein GF401_18955 [Chitinivibrionales bacterium]|nr:hypothetical protein [Chitinivibrionales bacterium]